jgi:hypothetical protein
MKIAIIETDHAISQTICRSIAEVCGFDLFNVSNAPNLLKYDCVLAYGILRGTADVLRSHQHWFEIDKGLWGAGHYDGLYRLSYRATQPIYGPVLGHDRPSSDMDGLGTKSGYTLICPPTEAVCKFFGIDGEKWENDRVDYYEHQWAHWNVRHKGNQSPIEWDKVGELVTFNSSLGFEALKRGIPVESNPTHSTIGSYYKNALHPNLSELLSFAEHHHFKLGDKEGICRIINHYLSSTSAMTPEKPLPQMSWNTLSDAGHI